MIQRVTVRSAAGCLLAAALVCGPAWARPLSTHAALHSAAHGAGARSQGYLGVEFHDVTEEQAAALRLKGVHGCEVAMVDHDGPAGLAGLRPHDIIVALNGDAVDASPTLRKLIHDAGAGASVTLEVIRGGHALTLTAKLASRDDVERSAQQRLATPAAQGFAPEGLSVETAPPPPNSRTQQFLSMLHTGPYTGLAMDTMEPQLAGFFGAPAGAGLLVHTVEANSPAAAAGMRAGDVVLRADGMMMKTTAEWTHHLRAARGGVVTLVVLRDRHEETVVLVPDSKRRSSLRVPPGDDRSELQCNCCCAGELWA